MQVAAHLHDEGARLIVTDIYPERIEEAKERFGAEAAEPDRIYDVDCDIFSPNALGAVINDETVGRLQCQVVAGAANNQLAEPGHGHMLQEKGILYAPDFVINGGGVTNVADAFAAGGYNRDRAYARIGEIYDKLLAIFAICDRDEVVPQEAAVIMAQERLEMAAALKRIHMAKPR